MICILNTIISYFGIEQAVLQRIDVIDFDRNQKEARVHFIPNLKVGVLVSSPGEFHPQALSEPYVRFSPHTAPIIQPLGLVLSIGSSLVAKVDRSRNWII